MKNISSFHHFILYISIYIYISISIYLYIYLYLSIYLYIYIYIYIYLCISIYIYISIYLYMYIYIYPYIYIYIYIYISVFRVLWYKKLHPFLTSTTQKEITTNNNNWTPIKYLDVLHHNRTQKQLQYFFLNIL